MYRIIQRKRTKSFSQSNIVYDGITRIRDARGQVKALFNSQIELIIKHQIFGDTYHIDEDRKMIFIYDSDGTILYAIYWKIVGD